MSPTPRLTPTARRADLHLRLVPGTDAALTNGLLMPYDKLVIATGSSPFVPPMDGLITDEGTYKKGAFVFRTLDDCKEIIDYAMTSVMFTPQRGGHGQRHHRRLGQLGRRRDPDADARRLTLVLMFGVGEVWGWGWRVAMVIPGAAPLLLLGIAYFLLLEGVALTLFSQMATPFLAVGAMIVFSLFVPMSEGATFSVVPFINRTALGSVAGIVGAGGNAGAVAFGFLFRAESLTYTDALMICGRGGADGVVPGAPGAVLAGNGTGGADGAGQRPGGPDRRAARARRGGLAWQRQRGGYVGPDIIESAGPTPYNHPTPPDHPAPEALPWPRPESSPTPGK